MSVAFLGATLSLCSLLILLWISLFNPTITQLSETVNSDVMCSVLTICAICLGLLSGKIKGSSCEYHDYPPRCLLFEFLNASQPCTLVEQFVENERIDSESSNDHQETDNPVLGKRHNASDDLHASTCASESMICEELKPTLPSIDCVNSSPEEDHLTEEESQVKDPEEDSCVSDCDPEINSKAAAFIASFRKRMRREYYLDMLLYLPP